MQIIITGIWFLTNSLTIIGDLASQQTTSEKQIHIKADAHGVCRFDYRETGDVSVLLMNSRPATSSVICLGGLCFLSKEIDCIDSKGSLSIAWHNITEKQTANLVLQHCDSEKKENIVFELIP